MVLTLVPPTAAALANNNASDQDRPPALYQPVPPLPPELGFAYHHASTAAEGALRGQAAVVHAAGNYWLSVAQALVCREQARAFALGNRQRRVEHRVTLRAWRALDRQRRTAEQREANEARRPNKYAVYRLSADQLDRQTGAIAWPRVLRAAEYDHLRHRLEGLFRGQAGYAATPAVRADEITRYTRTFSDELRRNRGGIGRAEYLAAQKFLCGLKYEPELVQGAGSGDPRTTAEAENPHATIDAGAGN